MKHEGVEHKVLRLSIVFVWLATALASVIELDGQSLQLLRDAGLAQGASTRASVLVLAGAGVDGVLGLWLLFAPSRRACLCALAAMAAMTIVATCTLPTLWLAPLGPLTKNVPIAAVLWLLCRSCKKSLNSTL